MHSICKDFVTCSETHMHELNVLTYAHVSNVAFI